MDLAILLGMLVAKMVDIVLIVFVIIAYRVSAGRDHQKFWLIVVSTGMLYAVLSTWLATSVGNVDPILYATLSVLGFSIDFLLVYGIAAFWKKIRGGKSVEN